jgi:hypothetical protein
MKQKLPKLQELFPQFENEWDFEKNKDFDFYQLTCGSKKKIWWVCEKGHRYQSTVWARAIRGSGCPYCNRNKMSMPLSKTDPRLVELWDFEKNKHDDPSSLTRGSHRKVWWKCKKGHSWQACVHNMARSKMGCLYCNNKRTGGDNNLAFRNPDIAAELHPTKNGKLKAEDVNYRSYRKVWWLGKCGHEWNTHVRCRTREKMPTGCPICAESKGENKVAEYLDSVKIKYEKQKRFDGCRDKKPLPFDFYLPDYNSLIEYQGIQHFEPTNFGGDYAGVFEYLVGHDRLKRDWALANSYRLLLISYMDYDKIDCVIEEFLKVR